MRQSSVIPADPNQLIGELGRALSELTVEGARSGAEEQFSIIADAVDLDRVEVWRIHRPSRRAKLVARWGRHDVPPLEPEFAQAEPDDRLSAALMATGTAVVPRSWIESLSSGAPFDVDARKLVVSVVDREAGPGPDDSEVTVLIAAPSTEAIFTLVTAVLGEVAVQLKQFNRRIRTQMRLEASIRLERILSTVARQLNRPDIDESQIDDLLEEIRVGLAARAMTISEYHGDRQVTITAVASPEIDLPVPTMFQLPEIDGVDLDALLIERFATRSMRVSEGMIESALGPEVSAAFGPLGDARSIITAPVGSTGRAGIAALREPERPWTASELEALTSLGVLIGQTRERIATKRAERRRVAGEQLLADAGVELADATPDTMHDDLRSVLWRFADHLELDGIGFFAVEPQVARYRKIAAWERTDSLHPRFPEDRAFGDRSHYDDARLTGEIQVAAADWPFAGLPPRLAVPIGSGDGVDHLLIVGDGRVVDRDADLDRLLSQLGRLLSHAVNRLEAERYAETAFRNSPIGIVISESDGTVLAANHACVEMMAAPDEAQLIGRSYHDFLVSPGDEIEFTTEPGLTVRTMRVESYDGRQWLARFENRRIPETSPSRWLSHITDVTDRRQAESRLRHAATHDALTGLPNRVALLEAVTAAAGGPEPALLLLDLDRFKNVNDSLGHVRGDELLVAIADRLRLGARPGEVVARLGGDEFGVLVPGPTDAVDATRVAERLLVELAEPVEIGGSRLYPAASIGIAIASATEPDDLIRKADVAMYRAKDAGRNRAVLFDDDLQKTVDDRHHIETGLRDALVDEQIEVHYQPEVDLISGKVLAAEALVRWRREDGTVMPAGAFIEIAEQAGLIHDIGLRVLDQACAEAVTWPGGPDGPKIRVNLSAEQLHRDDVVATVTRSLATHGLPARRLCLEITESAAMRDTARSEQALHELRSLGVELAIDDFGTGYSSLAYLKRFPFHTLKIDRSFVNDLEHDPDDVAFVGSIVYLARSLGLDVVAEGIETAGQVEALRGLGCTRGQGYHFAKPAPAAVLRARLGV
ncbi:MAG: bifunctional diguanylate cyclase/phosphodiesterase [Actinomycetota bacterium]